MYYDRSKELVNEIQRAHSCLQFEDHRQVDAYSSCAEMSNGIQNIPHILHMNTKQRNSQVKRVMKQLRSNK